MELGELHFAHNICRYSPNYDQNPFFRSMKTGVLRQSAGAPQLRRSFCYASRPEKLTSSRPSLRLASLAGTLPAGGDFCPGKSHQNPPRAFPLGTPLGYEAGNASSLDSARHPCCGSWYCHHTRPPWVAGPMARRFSPPGLPWRSGVPAAGSQVAVVGEGLAPPESIRAMPGKQRAGQA